MGIIDYQMMYEKEKTEQGNKGVADIGDGSVLTQTGHYQPQAPLIAKTPNVESGDVRTSYAYKGSTSEKPATITTSNPEVLKSPNVWANGVDKSKLQEADAYKTNQAKQVVAGAKGQTMSPDEKMRVVNAVKMGRGNEINPNTGERYTDAQQSEIKANTNPTWRQATTVTDDEKEEKANRTRLGILAIGDALRHMGNLYYTTKGATPQQFNSPVVDEYNRQKTEDKLSYESAKYAKEQARKDAELALKGEDINIKKGNLVINSGKANAYANTQKSIQDKNKADAERIAASADNIKQQARLNGVKADNQGALMQSQTNYNNARTSKSRSGIAVDASTIAKNNATTAKIWQELGQNQFGVKVNSYYGQLTRNRKAVPTRFEVANMYHSLSKDGLIDDKTQSEIAAILAKGDSSETTQKQINAIMKAMTQGTPKQRQMVAHELIGAGWYQTTSSTQNRQIATAKANMAKGTTAKPKAQSAGVRGTKRGGTKAVNAPAQQKKSSRGVV